MGKLYEFIDPEVETIIQTVISEKMENEDTPVKEKKRIESEFELYKKRHLSSSWNYNEKSYLRKQLTYNTLAELLHVAGMNVADIYSKLNIQVNWPSDDAQEFCDACDAMSKSTRDSFGETLYKSSPHYWREEEISNLQPTMRTKTMLSRLYTRVASNAELEKYLNDVVAASAKSKKWQTLSPAIAAGYNTIPFGTYPELSRLTGLPLHWLLRLNNTDVNREITILAKEPDTEFIYDVYAFLPPLSKQASLDLANSLAKKEVK